VQTRRDDPAFLIYTSGTTGFPKGALHAHRVLLGHLPGFVLSHDFFPQPGDVFWTPADWAWAGGLLDALLPTLQAGRPIVAYRFGGRFDPERVYALIERHGVRNAFVPPAALDLMRQAGPTHRRPELRTVMSGGEALRPDLLEWARGALQLTVNEIFGQTEANYVLGNSAAVYPVRPGSAGLPYPGHRLELLDPGGNPVTGDEPGEIAVNRNTPVMFLGYWNQEEATRAKFTGDWLLTGDVARRDRDGYFYLDGRRDDIINSAGYRIGPTEVEMCLQRHPAVAAAAVIGVPDAVRGTIVKAYVELAPGFRHGADLVTELQSYVKGRLAAYAYPREVEFIPQLPRTVTGKLQRDKLRKLHLERGNG
jgi:acetyl-CoA synthetase